MRVVSSNEMQTIENEAESTYGLSTSTLMERAGAAVAEQAVKMTAPGAKVLVVCGKGNNGGDGFVAARLLKARGYNVTVHCLARPNEMPAAAEDAFHKLPKDVGPFFDLETGRFDERLDDSELVIDAIFGFSLKGPVRGIAADIIDQINVSRKPVVSVDMPSGLEADTGDVYGRAIEAKTTVTFSAPKVGMLLYPGAGYVGSMVVADIGIPAEIIEGNSSYRVLDESEIFKHLPVRTYKAHKKSVGQVLIIAGSRGMAGAAILAARGAYRAGAGLVVVAAPDSTTDVISGAVTEAIVRSQAETDAGTLSLAAYEAILELSSEFDAVLIGPGLTIHTETAKLVRRLIADIDNPMVIDADGLNAIVGNTEVLVDRLAQTVITPHPGEMARLYGVTSKDVVRDWLGFARRAMYDFDAVTVLKGARTAISGIDETTINVTGNPGLATAGTGDVLAGIVAALMAQRVNRYDAAAISVYLHGLAADIAIGKLNEFSIIASDIVDYLPEAMKCVIEH